MLLLLTILICCWLYWYVVVVYYIDMLLLFTLLICCCWLYWHVVVVYYIDMLLLAILICCCWLFNRGGGCCECDHLSTGWQVVYAKWNATTSGWRHDRQLCVSIHSPCNYVCLESFKPIATHPCILFVSWVSSDMESWCSIHFFLVERSSVGCSMF